MVRMTKRRATGIIVIIVVVAILLIAFIPTLDEGKVGEWEARVDITADSYVSSIRRTDSFGDKDYIVVGSVSEGTFLQVRYISVLDWERLDFTENHTVASIKLNTLQVSAVTVSSEGDLVAICPTFSDWGGEGATWQTIDAYAQAYFQDACSVKSIDASLNWFSWDITDITGKRMPRIATLPVRTWYANNVTLEGRLFGYEGDAYGSTKLWFEYWEENGEGNTTDPIVTTTAGRFITAIPFEYNTTYYYQAVMVYGNDTYVGGMLGFKTCKNIYNCEEDSFIIHDSDGGMLAEDDDFPKAGWGNDTVAPTGVMLMAPYGYHLFASKNHNRPEMRPYVVYEYSGPKILTQAEEQHTFFWLVMAGMATPMGMLVYFLGKRFVRAVVFHWREEYDREAAKWLNRVNRFDYDPRDYGVFGEDKEDEQQ